MSIVHIYCKAKSAIAKKKKKLKDVRLSPKQRHFYSHYVYRGGMVVFF